MNLETITDVLSKAPLVALCILLVGALKVLYSDSKKERKYTRSEELKNIDTLTRVLEVVKENSLEKRNLSDKIAEFTTSLNRLIDKK